jgi:hypothetical protein
MLLQLPVHVSPIDMNPPDNPSITVFGDFNCNNLHLP